MHCPLILPLFIALEALGVLAQSGYAPAKVPCPAGGGSLVRTATGISDAEDTYRVARKATADEALVAWLAKTSPDFPTDGDMPALGFTVSGGGYRSMLTGAGVIQGLDARDSNTTTSGLWQAMTYVSALSGGGWLLSSLSSNNYAPVTQVKEEMWKSGLEDGLLDPGGNPLNLIRLGVEVEDKENSGFETTITDIWGRALSVQLLPGDDDGAAVTMSGLTALPSFANSTAPIPILTTMGVDSRDGECVPRANGTIWEISPFEFGSRMPDINAFVPTRVLGTTLLDGQGATGEDGCVSGFDNLGFLLGTSSSLFNFVCLPTEDIADDVAGLIGPVAATLEMFHVDTSTEQFAVVPNPFVGVDFTAATLSGDAASNANLAEELNLFLVDGGEGGHNTPIAPLLAPERNISVLFVSDNSGDENNFPTGEQVVAQAAIASQNPALASRMPKIPGENETFADGSGRAVFYGCGEPGAITIVYLPNAAFVPGAQSNKSTTQLQYSGEETDLMVQNGVQIAGQGDDEGWGLCVACAVMKKAVAEEKLPSGCEACFGKYCV
ncbi:hypothetical protein MKZ38_002432 [Zalerion maritima]|uniref:Lysophospholipase n=1 Tax=Zalerion maritima TaxID=339359 RepID=A0AAD5WT48_9PEZI|nr:hypothetical protein MKZ38_002432 [Zalerion maritima]